jgi:hypothetical protein
LSITAGPSESRKGICHGPHSVGEDVSPELFSLKTIGATDLVVLWSATLLNPVSLGPEALGWNRWLRAGVATIWVMKNACSPAFAYRLCTFVYDLTLRDSDGPRSASEGIAVDCFQ